MSETQTAIFHGPEEGPVRRPRFRTKIWLPAVEAAGLEGFRFKDLRHTGASLAIAVGPDLKEGAEGHTTIRMSADTYVTLFEGQDREIAELLDRRARRAEDESRRLRSMSKRVSGRPCPSVRGTNAEQVALSRGPTASRA